MIDNFRQAIEIRYQTDKTWQVLTAIYNEVQDCYESIEGAEVGEEIDFRGLSRDNKHFRRKSLEELETAFRENHADMVSVNSTMYGDQIRISADSYHRADGSVVVEVAVKSHSRMLTERTAKDLLPKIVEARLLKKWVPDAHVSLGDMEVSSSDNGYHQAASNAQGQAVKGLSPAPAATEQPTATKVWLQNKWRDHTVSFLITVVGGVLAVAAAAWLGFGGGG